MYDLAIGALYRQLPASTKGRAFAGRATLNSMKSKHPNPQPRFVAWCGLGGGGVCLGLWASGFPGLRLRSGKRLYPNSRMRGETGFCHCWGPDCKAP